MSVTVYFALTLAAVCVACVAIDFGWRIKARRYAKRVREEQEYARAQWEKGL